MDVRKFTKTDDELETEIKRDKEIGREGDSSKYLMCGGVVLKSTGALRKVLPRPACARRRRQDPGDLDL